MNTLREKLDEALAELAGLRAREADRLESSGLREQLEALNAENQRLSEQRQAARMGLEAAQRDLANAWEHHGVLELQLKGARARVARLTLVLRGQR